MEPRSRPSRRRRLRGLTTSLALLAGCGGASGGVATPGPDEADEAEWQALAVPRPRPLPGAVRLALGGFELAGQPGWSLASPLPLPLAASELVAAGLLRRADVHFVERRRFAAAVAAEGSDRRTPGAPAAGVSAGAELVASVTWVPLGAAAASLEVRLTAAATGANVTARRASVPIDADPVGLARQVVSEILAGLRELGRLPEWADPVPASAPAVYQASRVPREAVESFLAGLAAEERWRWEDARREYVAALRAPGFIEAAAALARTARLRLGGTLGES